MGFERPNTGGLMSTLFTICLTDSQENDSVFMTEPAILRTCLPLCGFLQGVSLACLRCQTRHHCLCRLASLTRNAQYGAIQHLLRFLRFQQTCGPEPVCTPLHIPKHPPRMPVSENEELTGLLQSLLRSNRLCFLGTG